MARPELEAADMRRAIYVILNAVYGQDPRPLSGLWTGVSRLGQSDPRLTRETYGRYMAARRAQLATTRIEVLASDATETHQDLVHVGA